MPLVARDIPSTVLAPFATTNWQVISFADQQRLLSYLEDYAFNRGIYKLGAPKRLVTRELLFTPPATICPADVPQAVLDVLNRIDWARVPQAKVGLLPKGLNYAIERFNIPRR